MMTITDTGTVNAQDVARIVREAFGVTLDLEHTGGNCAALAGDLETGHVLVITDADILVYDAGMSQPFYGAVSVGIYTHDGWRVESEDSIADGYVEGSSLDSDGFATSSITAEDVRKAVHAAFDALSR